MKYKNLRQQMIECKESGNLIEVDVSDEMYFHRMIGLHYVGDVELEKINVCIEYKCICNGGIPGCREKRGIKNEIKSI